MTRVGPNQDINDPTTLEDLRLIVEEISVRANDHNNASIGITETKSAGIKVHPDNTRIIPITTLLSKQDGSSAGITGFTTSGTYLQENMDLYTESVINTYINQAERFREYYDNIVSIANSWSSRDNGSPSTTSSLVSQTPITGLPIGEHRGWAEVNMGITQKDGYAVVDQSVIPVSIDWSGSGPVDYNSNTYPQLTSVFENLQTRFREQSQPFLDIDDELSTGHYTSADPVNGFSKNIDLFERTEWDSDVQKFAQTSGRLVGQSDLDSPIGIITASILRIPIMMSNFTNNSQNLASSVTVTITPRNSSNRIFTPGHVGFVNRRIIIFNPSPIESETRFIQHDGLNTSAVNDMLTDTFELQADYTVFMISNSVGVHEIEIAFVNQVRIINGSFTDWDTEDLLSDINVQVSFDGHSINQDFTVGIERSMWA